MPDTFFCIEPRYASYGADIVSNIDACTAAICSGVKPASSSVSPQPSRRGYTDANYARTRTVVLILPTLAV